MRTLTLVLALATGCDRNEPIRDCGWPDIPPIPGSRYLRETTEETWNTCDVIAYIGLDRTERLDIHPVSNYRNFTFSTAADPYGFLSDHAYEDSIEPGLWLPGRDTTRRLYTGPDGEINRDVEESITLTLRIDDFESIEVVGEFEIFCPDYADCRVFNSRNDHACGFGRRWTYSYAYEIDDYVPQSARWLEPDDCDAPDSPYRE